MPADFRRRRLAVSLVGLALLVAGIALFVLAAPPVSLRPAALIAPLRDAGPWIFFGAMGLLPVIGFPLAPFNLAAGPAFAPTLGLAPTCLLAVAAIAINTALTYWLSRYILRPLATRAATWLGYRIPEIPADKQLAAAFLVRATPGPPFFLQSCLLGLARVCFAPYMIASCIVPGAFAVLCIVGGDALMKGNTRLVLLAFGALGAIAIALKLLRRRQPGSPASP